MCIISQKKLTLIPVIRWSREGGAALSTADMLRTCTCSCLAESTVTAIDRRLCKYLTYMYMYLE